MSPNPNTTSSDPSFSTNQIQEIKNDKKHEQVSSFPRIWKRPSSRDSYFRNAMEWMNGKRQDEGIGNGLWRVHDKLYNLGAFISQHPGGSDWISMTNGTDITEAFEASHVVNASSVRRILAKYYVTEASTPRNSPYTFDRNGFYKVLQERAEPVLKKVGTGPIKSLVIFQDFLVLIYLILYAASTVIDSFPLHVLTGLSLGFVVTCAHNFFHIKDNWRKYYFDLGFVSSFEWRLGHSLSHHLFPNTVMDYEIYLLEPFMEMSSNKKRNWAQKYLAHAYIYVLYTQFFGMELLKRIYLVFLVRRVSIRPENLFPLIQLFICQYMTSFLGGFYVLFIINSTASFYFSFVGEAMAAHHHPKSFHEGDDVRDEPDFGLCQLDVTKASIEDVTRNIFVAAATFGEHPLHHLFPTVCHSKLHHLQPVVQQVLAEYSEKIDSVNSLDKFTGIHYVLARAQLHT